MKWARIQNDLAIEVTDIDPAGRFHPSLKWENVPDETVPNSRLVNGEWIHPPIAVEPAPQPPADEQQPAAETMQ